MPRHSLPSWCGSRLKSSSQRLTKALGGKRPGRRCERPPSLATTPLTDQGKEKTIGQHKRTTHSQKIGHARMLVALLEEVAGTGAG